MSEEEILVAEWLTYHIMRDLPEIVATGIADYLVEQMGRGFEGVSIGTLNTIYEEAQRWSAERSKNAKG
jgi:hypothetical protein